MCSGSANTYNSRSVSIGNRRSLSQPVTAAPYLRRRSALAFASTSTTRSASLPDVPAASEVLDAPGLNSWFGLSAPRGTPSAVIDKLSAHIKQTLAEPEIVSRFDTLGGIPHYLGPAEFGAFVNQEMVYYTKALKHRSTTK